MRRNAESRPLTPEYTLNTPVFAGIISQTTYEKIVCNMMSIQTFGWCMPAPTSSNDSVIDYDACLAASEVSTFICLEFYSVV